MDAHDQEGELRLWDASHGDVLAPPLRHYGEVRSMAISPDGQRVLIAIDRGVMVWDFGISSLPVDALDQMAQLLARRHIDATGSMVPLRPAEALAVWQILQRSQRVWSEPAITAKQLWHQRQAEENENSRRWFGAAFHLGQLLKDEPEDASLHTRYALAIGEWKKQRTGSETP
jgi:hypothetical protein